jgi:hypothetical protein
VGADPLTLGDLLAACEEIELRNAKIYAAFSLLLGERDERVERFWENLSIEEWRHYITVSFGRTLCRKHLGLETPVPEIDRAAIEKIRRTLDRIEADVAAGSLDLRGAFERAIECEKSEANAIYMVLVGYLKRAVETAGKPYLLKRIAATEENVDEHVHELIEEMKRLAGDPALVREAKRTLA